MRPRFVLIILALMAIGGPAQAQEKSHVGLTMSFPGAVGVIWQATDGLAIRPDFVFSQSGATSLSSNLSVGVGVSALFYVEKWDNLRAYVSPRFGYQRSSFTYSSEFSSP